MGHLVKGSERASTLAKERRYCLLKKSILYHLLLCSRAYATKLVFYLTFDRTSSLPGLASS